ncbi:MAG: response regulator [Planctomycetes bacterium]|nr:response regulator [Planctomycetota bacterium]
MADLLLVDNDERIVELTAWFLERAGHRVRAALSYAEARGLLEEAPAQLLLADLELGAERGREELPKLAAAGLLPPTLVVSGFLDATLEAELLAIPGVIGTLAKPVDLATLERCVAEAVAGAEREVELTPVAPPAVASTLAHDAPRLGEPDEDGWVEVLPEPPERAS